MCENPFFEVFGATFYSRFDQRRRVDDEFEQFRDKHGKKYKDDQELSQKKNIFKHNLRFSHFIYFVVNFQNVQGYRMYIRS